MGRASEKARRRTCREKGIDLSLVEHVRKGLVTGNRLVVDIRRYLKAQLLNASGSLFPTAPPVHVSRVYPIFVLENTLEPDNCCQLVFGDPDDLSLKIFRSADSFVDIDVYTRVTEESGGKHGDSDKAFIPP